MRTLIRAGSLGGLLLLGACVSVPSGPNVMVLPGTGKSFELFRADDLDCRVFAHNQVGGATPDSVADSSGVKSAVVGAGVGALAGAIVGGQQGAATGAGLGLIVGGVSGAGAAGASQRTLQQRYDHAFVQCMYARGHKVPAGGRFAYTTPAPAAPAVSAPPPPPAGTPPPPPPGVTR
jgi:hypothetical protein